MMSPVRAVVAEFLVALKGSVTVALRRAHPQLGALVAASAVAVGVAGLAWLAFDDGGPNPSVPALGPQAAGEGAGPSTTPSAPPAAGDDGAALPGDHARPRDASGSGSSDDPGVSGAAVVAGTPSGTTGAPLDAGAPSSGGTQPAPGTAPTVTTSPSSPGSTERPPGTTPPSTAPTSPPSSDPPPHDDAGVRGSFLGGVLDLLGLG
jgi:hypothetical protein